MAIYHLNARHCQRSRGQSAAAKFDYITRQGRYEQQDDKCVYWSSGNMPDWAQGDSRQYWAAADAFERANASLGKEVEVALP